MDFPVEEKLPVELFMIIHGVYLFTEPVNNDSSMIARAL